MQLYAGKDSLDSGDNPPAPNNAWREKCARILGKKVPV